MSEYTCENCYYRYFDSKAYPCSMCIMGEERKDMFKPKRVEQTKPQQCDDCVWSVCNYNKVDWERAEQTEPQRDIHDLTDCDFCKDRNCKGCEGGKDEPQTEK